MVVVRDSVRLRPQGLALAWRVISAAGPGMVGVGPGLREGLRCSLVHIRDYKDGDIDDVELRSPAGCRTDGQIFPCGSLKPGTGTENYFYFLSFSLEHSRFSFVL